LQEMEFEVFYDRNEQHSVLAEDIGDYLRPIYQADARFVIAQGQKIEPERSRSLS
jgi:hypothetical protein